MYRYKHPYVNRNTCIDIHRYTHTSVDILVHTCISTYTYINSYVHKYRHIHNLYTNILIYTCIDTYIDTLITIDTYS